MPNLCVNKITIEGDRINLEKLKKKINEFKTISEAGDNIFFMEYLIGLGDIPTDYKDFEIRTKYRKRWFGTDRDFDISELGFHFTKDNIQIDVESAWSPVIPFLSTLCKNYKVSAIIDYFESMADFGGRAIIDINGKIDESTYSFRDALVLYDPDNYMEALEPYLQKMDMIEYEDFSMRWWNLHMTRKRS